MAQYTVELRDIIESDLDLFDFNYDFYTDNTQLKANFEEMFVAHYYFHEIGFETVERFKHNLRAKINLNAPYYKQVWDSHLRTMNIDFAINKDYTEEQIRELLTESELKSNATTNAKAENTRKTNTDTTTKTSDINNGVSGASLEDEFLTNKSNGVSTDESTDNTNTSSNNASERVGADKHFEKIKLVGKGNIGATSSAQLIKEWRQIMLNINRDIIKDCADLFMLLY